MLFIIKDEFRTFFTIFDNDTKKNVGKSFRRELAQKIDKLQLQVKKNYYIVPADFNLMELVHTFYEDVTPAYVFKIKNRIKVLEEFIWIKKEVFVKINGNEDYRKFTLKESEQYAPTAAKKFNTITQ